MRLKIIHIIEIGNNPETQKFLEILQELLEDPKGEKKKEIMDKLEKIIADIKTTV